MPKKLLSILLIIASHLITFAQGTGWNEYFSSIRLKKIAHSNSKIFAASDNTLLIYDTQSQDLQRLSPPNSISDHNITGILYTDSNDALIIIYKTGNIDVLRGNEVINLPFVLYQSQILDKQLNCLTQTQNSVFIGGNFGILKLNPQKLQITQFCIFPDNNKVLDLTVKNDTLIALTNEGFYYITLNQDISLFENWNFKSFNNLKQIDTSQQTVFFSTYDGNSTSVYNYYTPNTPLISLAGYYNLRIIDNKIYLLGKNVLEFDTTGNLIRQINFSNTTSTFVNDAIELNGNFYYADSYNGIIINDGQDFIKYDSPLNDYISNIYVKNNKIIILYKPEKCDSITGNLARYSIFAYGKWQHYNLDFDSYLTCAIPNPIDSSIIFFGTVTKGLLEVQNGHIIANYNNSNSPLTGIGSTLDIRDLFVDENNILWILLESSAYPIVKFDLNTQTWSVEQLSAPAANHRTFKFVKTQDFLWANLYDYGLLGIDYITNTAQAFYPAAPQIGNSINSFTIDKDQNLWIATNDGLGYLQYIDLKDYTVVRPKVEITLNDTTIYSYLLDNTITNDIATDPANRKWVATQYGIYLLSEDGSEQLNSFSRLKGNFLTDDISRIVIDAPTGKVYFVTGTGLISYQSDCSQGASNFQNVKIFPNPVRTNLNPIVTITGLMYNSIIKITDIEGNLVFETTSNGGTAQWNLNSLNGSGVHSGVYLIFCINEKTSQKCVKKLLIIK